MAAKYAGEESESHHEDDLMISQEDNSSETSVTSFLVENNMLPDVSTSPGGEMLEIPQLSPSNGSDSTSKILVDPGEWHEKHKKNRSTPSNTALRQRSLQSNSKSARRLQCNTPSDQDVSSQDAKKATASDRRQHAVSLTDGNIGNSSPASHHPPTRDCSSPSSRAMAKWSSHGSHRDPDKSKRIERKPTNSEESDNTSKTKTSKSLRKKIRKGLSSRGLQKALSGVSKGSRRRLGMISGPAVEGEPFPASISLQETGDASDQDPLKDCEQRKCMAEVDGASTGGKSGRTSSRRPVVKASRSMGSEDFSKLIDANDSPVFKRSFSFDNLVVEAYDVDGDDAVLASQREDPSINHGTSSRSIKGRDSAKDQTSHSLRKRFRKGLSTRGLHKALNGISKGTKPRTAEGGPSKSRIPLERSGDVKKPLPTGSNSSINQKPNTPSEVSQDNERLHITNNLELSGEPPPRRSARRASRSMGSEDLSKLFGFEHTLEPTRSLSCKNLVVERWDDEDDHATPKEPENCSPNHGYLPKQGINHGGRRALDAFKKVSKSTRSMFGKSSEDDDTSANVEELRSSSNHSNVKLSYKDSYNEDSTTSDRRGLLSHNRGSSNHAPFGQDNRTKRSQELSTRRNTSDSEHENDPKQSKPGILHKASQLFSSKTIGTSDHGVSNFSMFSTHSDEKYSALVGSVSSFASDNNSSSTNNGNEPSLAEIPGGVVGDSGLPQFQVETPLPFGTERSTKTVCKTRNGAYDRETTNHHSAPGILEFHDDGIDYPSFRAQMRYDAVCSPDNTDVTSSPPDLSARISSGSTTLNGDDLGSAQRDSPYGEDSVSEPKEPRRRRRGSASALRDFPNRRQSETQSQCTVTEKSETKPSRRQSSSSRRSRSQRKIRVESQDDQTGALSTDDLHPRSNSIADKRPQLKRQPECESETESGKSNEVSRGREKPFSKSKSSRDLADPLRRSLHRNVHRQPSRRRLNNVAYALPLDYDVSSRDTLRRAKSDDGLFGSRSSLTEALPTHEKKINLGNNKTVKAEDDAIFAASNPHSP